MGTPAFAVPTLRRLAERHDVVAVVTRPDKGRGRGRRTAFSEVKEWAAEAGLAIEQPKTLRDADVQARLAAYGADVFVVAAFGLILPKEVLEMPPLGCVNVHASLLPRHRGAAPVAWAILAGDEQTGITTMLMDEGLDTGPMLLRRSLPLEARATAGEVTETLASIGADLLIETLATLESGELAPQPQPAEGATLAPSLKKADGAIDWSADATAVDRRVRALQPWPGSFTFRLHGGDRLVVWEVSPVGHPSADPPSDDPPSDHAPSDHSPGTVIQVGADSFRVACGQGAVDVLSLQRAGSRRQSAAEFLRGNRVEVGERLGDEGG